MTNLTANTDTRTDPDQAGSGENDTHQIWHNRDKSGQIWTEPDGFSQNSQSRATKPSNSTQILRSTRTPAPRYLEGSDRTT